MSSSVNGVEGVVPGTPAAKRTYVRWRTCRGGVSITAAETVQTRIAITSKRTANATPAARAARPPVARARNRRRVALARFLQLPRLLGGPLQRRGPRGVGVCSSVGADAVGKGHAVMFVDPVWRCSDASLEHEVEPALRGRPDELLDAEHLGQGAHQ